MGQTLNGALTEEVRLENFSINHTACSAICVFTCDLIQCSFCFFNFLACFSQEVLIMTMLLRRLKEIKRDEISFTRH